MDFRPSGKIISDMTLATTGSSDIMDTILYVLATTYLADGPTESITKYGCKADIIALKYIRNMGFDISEARLLYWFEFHKDKINEALSHAHFKDWYYGLLNTLNDSSHQTDIIKAMKSISSNNIVSRNNSQALINLTERYWSET